MVEKIFKVEISKTPKSIVGAIRFFELEFGENYLEYNDIFQDSSSLVNYAYKQGYMDADKYNEFSKAYEENDWSVEDTFQVIFSDDEEELAVKYYDESLDQDYEQQYEDALLVYGELICSDDKYFNAFVNEYSTGGGNLDYIEVVVNQ